MAELKHDASVGRLLIIDVNNPPDLTAEEFMQYVEEGFIPVLVEVAVDTEMPNKPAGYSYMFCQFMYRPGEGVAFLNSPAEIPHTLPSFYSVKTGSSSDSNEPLSGNGGIS